VNATVERNCACAQWPPGRRRRKISTALAGSDAAAAARVRVSPTACGGSSDSSKQAAHYVDPPRVPAARTTVSG